MLARGAGERATGISWLAALATCVVAFACGGEQPRTATPEEAARLYPELYVNIGRAEPPPKVGGG